MSFPFGPKIRPIMRVPSNPMDKSTIVSAFIKDLDELKPTLQPGRFFIPAPKDGEEFTTTVVGPSSWFKEMELDQPMLEMVVPSVEIARSVIDDFCNGLLACDMHESKPALFWVPGAYTKAEIKTKFASELEQAIQHQRNWFTKLCALADAFWIRSNGNPVAISDDMKIAARALNLIDKPWLKDSYAAQLVKCKACGTLIQSTIVVCPNCKVVLDAKRFAEMKLEFAG